MDEFLAAAANVEDLGAVLDSMSGASDLREQAESQSTSLNSGSIRRRDGGGDSPGAVLQAPTECIYDETVYRTNNLVPCLNASPLS